MSEIDRYTIEDLVARTGFSRRTIRFYVQEGLLEPPAGRGRGGFYYDSHLARLELIKSLQAQGLKLSAIRERLVQGVEGATAVLQASPQEPLAPPVRETWAGFDVAPGLELWIRRDMEERLGGRLTDIIRTLKTTLLEEEEHGK